MRLKICRCGGAAATTRQSLERKFLGHEYGYAMSLSTALLVVVVWTVIAIVAGLWIAKVLRRRSEEAQAQMQVPRSENFRNSA